MLAKKEVFENKFFEEYKKLNDQQRTAVDIIEGPVMVIAGPGTGKTQILASRIGKILLDTDASPDNILCLTYTDAGVVAMRKRLVQFIGPHAYKVNIYTFHAFCNDIIQENLSLFEKTALDPISDLGKIQLFKDLINSFSKNHPLKRYRGDVYFEINNLQSLFSVMKREGWTPAFINQQIDQYVSELPNRDEFIYKKKYKEFNVGDLKKDKINEEIEKIEKTRAAVNEFERFQELMYRKNLYDFDDMILWVIKAFESNQNLLANYQERFLYILVDEYQDTNGTQNKLIKLLINYWDKPNVFVVGDDDQSIYRFQGANVENMHTFAANYKKYLTTVVLTNNYRSTQAILDISKSLIDRNEERLVRQISGLSKELVSSNSKINNLIHQPILQEYESQGMEMIGITNQIQQLLAKDVQPGRIAVIYKENKYGEELAQYFKLLNLPVFTKRNQNVLELPLAQKIFLLLRYLAAEHDAPTGGDEMLFEILHVDWFCIPPIEIAKISMQVAEKQFSADKTSIRRLLIEKSKEAPKDLFSQSLNAELKKASVILEKLIGDVPNITLQQLFENVIREAGVLNSIMQSTEKHWQLQILTCLFNFLKEETHRNPRLRLTNLISLIDIMEQEKIALPLVEISGNDKGVNFLTAHGSKGLEFKYVFFTGCNASSWEKKRKPGGGYKLPDTMFSSQPNASENEELRRLFYVALTRAEQYLYISYSKYKNDGKELEPSMFLAEIQSKHSLLVERPILDTSLVDKFAALHFGSIQQPEIEKIENEFITRQLEKFVMNVTALNNFLKCPLEFYFKNLVRIPSPKNEATEFGSSIHYALEQLFSKMQKHEFNQFSSKENLIKDFDWYMHRHRENFTKDQFDRRLEYGQKILSDYYDAHINSFNKVVSIERSIRNVVINGVPLKGKLDKLEFDGKMVNVVDYKTGDPDKGISKLKGPHDKDPNGGDYWRQAVFYKILIDNYETKDWKVVSTEFDFIEPDKKKKYRKEKMIITSSDTTTVMKQIIETWEKIQARDFYKGCGKTDCHWCHFVKTNNLAIALHQLEEESTFSE